MYLVRTIYFLVGIDKKRFPIFYLTIDNKKKCVTISTFLTSPNIYIKRGKL